MQGWDRRPPVKIAPQAGAKQKTVITPEALDALVKSQGVRVKVYRTSFCPNVKSIDSAEHNIDCKVCVGGSGFLDVHPLETWALIQSQELKKNQHMEVYYDGNTVSATFLSDVELQYYTLVELRDFSDIFIELIKRQEGPVDILKYRALKVNFLIDANGKEYLAGTDFNLDANGSIVWIGDRGPIKSQIYTIHYEAAIQFRAIKAQHIHRFLQVSLKQPDITMRKAPQQWMLQKEFLVRREDLLGNALAQNKIRESDEE